MPLYAELPPPRDWQVFEDLCRDLFAAEWEDPETKKHGRSGQADQGVDVFGLRDGQWVGVQCKRRQKWPEKKLTEGEIRAEVEASRKFSSPLESLVIATTAEDSTHFDALARQLTDEVGFRVAIYGWQELCRRIQTHPKVYAVWHQNLLPHPAGPIPIHLPFLPLGDLLKGRQPELEALAAGLAPGSGRGAFAVIQQRTEAVHGLGGVGKTALAVEHAWNWQKFYSAVLFIRAESPELLRASLAELGPKVGLERIEEEAAATEAVLTWLGDHSGWLVILDNVDDEKAARAVTELLPQLTTGRVLITSRLSNWSARVTEFPLSELTTEEAVAFLLARAEKRLPTSQEAIQSAALAERLGGLPLALEQAAAYINVHRLSFSDYSGLLEEQSREVLEWFDSRLMTYPRSVAETWQPTFARLGVSARAMLHLLAFLDAEEIPRSLFEGAKAEPVLKEASDALGSEGKEEEFSLQEAVRELDSYSFLEVDGEGFSIHRMVQAVVRSRLREGEVDEWVGRGISLLLAAHPGNPTDARYWPQWERLRLHATSVIHHARSFGFAEPKLATLMNNTGLYLTERVLFSEAESLYRHALSIDESSYGGDHPTVAIRLNNLAVLLQSTNRMSESEPLMRRALEIDESSYGADHPRVAVQLNNLAQLLQSTNRLSESEPLMRRALEIDESSYGGGHP
nr:tetratricopeptide repeat protein [Deltaproteobacteria bacterium]